MTPDLSLLIPNSPPHSLPFDSYSKPISRKPRLFFNPRSQKPQENLRTKTVEPPWLVPAPPPDPFSRRGGAGGLLLEHQFRDSGRIPFSLHLLQLKKKNSILASNPPALSSEFGPAGNAVWSLACLLGDVQRSALSVEKEEDLDLASRDCRDSVVWLFRRVFFCSPELAVGLLVLTAKFVVGSVERIVLNIGAGLLELEGDHGEIRMEEPMEKIGDYERWSDIGILDQSLQRIQGGDGYRDYIQKKTAYEHMIVAEKANSLILSNYAQLLYQYEKDFERANDYFRRAVAALPVDAEAISRYALFLWHAQGDEEGAEEMFLGAIEADPKNNYHQSNYAWFLWNTGGTDTCFPLDDCGVDDTDDDREKSYDNFGVDVDGNLQL